MNEDIVLLIEHDKKLPIAMLIYRICPCIIRTFLAKMNTKIGGCVFYMESFILENKEKFGLKFGGAYYTWAHIIQGQIQ